MGGKQPPYFNAILWRKIMFNRDSEKETVNILLQENKKLKRDNQRLRESLDELERYKKEYRELIGRLSDVEGVY